MPGLFKGDREDSGPTLVSHEARRLSLLPAGERPDMVQSLKLGLDPMAPIITSVYEFEEVLGRGAFGEVQRGRHIESSRCYAIKKLATAKLKQSNLKAEIRILKECRHPNIVALREVFATEEYIYLVMELATGGALMDMVAREGSLSESLCAKATAQIADALAFMHRAGVVHRDMKPENLLLADEASFIIKICDFGLSKMVHGVNDRSSRDKSSSSRAASTASLSAAVPNTEMNFDDRALVMKSRVGTQWYASPELLNGAETYDQSIDMWGLGLVIYILLSGKHPFECDDMYGAITTARLPFAEPVWKVVHDSCLDLVRGVLKAKPVDRLTAEEVLAHPWLKEGVASEAKLEVSLSELNRFRSRQVRQAAFKAVASALKPDEVAEVRGVFDWVDADKKGYLRAEDLDDALKGKAKKALGLKTTPRPKTASRYNLPLLLRRLRSSLRTKGGSSPVVTFDEFLRAVLEADDELVKRQLLKVFGELDSKQSGTIHVDDIRRTLRDFGLEADSLGGVSQVLRASANTEGRLSYDEFIELFLSLHREQEVTRVTGRMTMAFADAAAAEASLSSLPEGTRGSALRGSLAARSVTTTRGSGSISNVRGSLSNVRGSLVAFSAFRARASRSGSAGSRTGSVASTAPPAAVAHMPARRSRFEAEISSRQNTPSSTRGTVGSEKASEKARATAGSEDRYLEVSTHSALVESSSSAAAPSELSSSSSPVPRSPSKVMWQVGSGRARETSSATQPSMDASMDESSITLEVSLEVSAAALASPSEEATPVRQNRWWRIEPGGEDAGGEETPPYVQEPSFGVSVGVAVADSSHAVGRISEETEEASEPSDLVQIAITEYM